MINIDDRILDQYDEKELYLLLKIARRMRTNRTAWPSLKTLMEDTGWSKNTILKVRESLQKKGALDIENRVRENGSNTSNEYRVTAEGIGIYTPLKDAVLGGSKNEQAGVQKMNKGGSKNEQAGVQKMNKKEEVNNINKVIREKEGVEKRLGKAIYASLVDAVKDEKTSKKIEELDQDGKFDLLCEWLEYRHDKKKKITAKGILILVNKFLKHNPEEISVAIEKSIESDYTGLFIKPIKKQSSHQRNEPPKDAQGNEIKYKPQGDLKGYARILALRDKLQAQKAAQ